METLVNAWNIHICAEYRLSSFVASQRNKKKRSRKSQHSYANVVKHATNQATAENDAAVPLYVQPTNMTPRKYAGELITKALKVVEEYHRSPLNDTYIEGVDASARRCLRNCWEINAQADFMDIEFKEKFLLSIQKGFWEHINQQLPGNISGKTAQT